MAKKENGPGETGPWELRALPVAPAEGTRANADLQKIIRKNYREPITDGDAVCAKIDGLTYQVSDLGRSGLSLIVPTPEGFLAGSSRNIALHLGTEIIALRGRITHLSPRETSDEFHCGIEFIDLNPKDKQTLQNFLTAHHAKLFAKTSRPGGPGRN
jgi:hypothetical protein